MPTETNTQFPEELTVVVTQEDIDKGQAAESRKATMRCNQCPIAQAVLRLFPDYGVSVTQFTIRIWSGAGTKRETLARYEMPAEAKKFIHQADTNSATLEPFTFETERESVIPQYLQEA